MSEQPEQPQARGVRIDAQLGDATIVLDGNRIPPGTVTGYVLEHHVNETLPQLVLYTRQRDHVAFEGLARVAVGIPASPGDVITAFLAEVDPVLLDQEALNRSDYGGGPGATARAMLQTLAEWARGGKAGT